jgi:endonuclease III
MDPARLRIKPIIRLLRKHYPNVRTALEYADPLQILVATILAAQSTDKLVNTVTPGLFRKYPSAAAFARADRAELEQAIHSTGFFRNKAKHIIGATQKIVADYGGAVPDTMEKLLTLPGVARKTANIVLAAGFGKAEGIAVDTHAGRLSRRLGLSREEDPVKVERDLMALVPKDDWIDFNFLLVDHGRAICQARQPKCPECFLRKLCPSAVKFFPELRTS